MGLRFRQTFTLFPGVRLNVGKKGISASFGVPGATVNLSKRGVRATVGLPGSGLSYSADLAKFGGNAGQQDAPPQYLHPEQANYYMPPDDGMRPITSAGVEYLTSYSLIPLRDLIMKAREQRLEVCADLLQARELATSQRDELQRRKISLFRRFYKKKIAALEEALPVTLAEVARLEAWEEQTHIKIQFNAGKYPRHTYAQLEKYFADMAKSTRVWDVTAERATDQFAERTRANRTVERTPVKFDFSHNDLLKFEGQAMRFTNANGNDILLYPGMALIPGHNGAFALIDFRELEITGCTTRFQESEAVPSDSEVIGYTWAKCNKDGSPDRRFNGNYQIPIVRYGHLTFSSEYGLNEEFMLSNIEAVEMFHRAAQLHKQALELAEEEAEFMALIPD